MDPTTEPMQRPTHSQTEEPKPQPDLLPNDQEISTRTIPPLTLTPYNIRQEMHREVDDAISAAREQHNAGLPINSFPPELLMSIFQEVLETVKRGSVKGTLGAISLVCRHWNRVIINSPALWTQWYESDGPEYLERVRVLSKARGLTIDCSIPVNYQIWDVIKEEMYRWHRVYFTLRDQPHQFLAELPKLGRETTPKLQTLNISVETEPSLGPVDLFEADDPCELEELGLSGISLVWDAVKLEHLRRLWMLGPLEPPSVAQLLRILERNQQLETLFLLDIVPPAEPNDPSMPSQPVYLPHLSSLILLCSNSTDLLIRAMRFPQCSILVATIHVSDPDSDSSLTHVVDVIGNVIKNSQTILSVSQFVFSISTADSKGTSVHFEGDLEVALSWFIDATSTAIKASPGIALDLNGNFSYDWTMQTISKLGRLRAVTALQFVGGRPVGDRCNPLGCLDNLGDKIQHYFPRLEKLQCWINTLSELESLRRVILRRHETPAGQEQSNMSPLQEVIIEHNKKWSLREDCNTELNMIKALITGGNLKLYPRAV